MKEQFTKIEEDLCEEEKEQLEYANIPIEERNKNAKIFYGTATVYLEDYKTVEKLYFILTIIVSLIICYSLLSYLMLSFFALIAILVIAFFIKDILIKKLYLLISSYNSSYAENNLLLKRLLGKALNKKTWYCISFNEKTEYNKNGVEKRYWNILIKEEFASEKFNIQLENVLDNIDTIQEISELKKSKITKE